MPKPSLQLPTLQNWSCHNCSGCCREHLIEITEEERQRILAQNWTPADGLPADRPPLVAMGPPWNRRWRLGHQADGACVFLDEKGLCRIHAKHGEAAKPLACRVYPYAFHPSGKQVTVSLRFSCPSVVANEGKAVAKNRGEVDAIAREVVPENNFAGPPPNISKRERVQWPDFLRFVRALDATFEGGGEPFLVRLLRALYWVRMAGEMRFNIVQGGQLNDLLQIVRGEADLQVPSDILDNENQRRPGRAARLRFRMLLANYARKDTAAQLESGWKGRWKLLRAAVRFARGTGDALPLQPVFRAVPFATLEEPFGGLPDGADELFTRYFRVKIGGLHFCGPAYYGVPFVEGFQSLALIVPAIWWMSRWLAAGDGRDSLSLEDVQTATALADHHHGYSPVFGSRHFRSRVRSLAGHRDIERLCLWYAR